MREVTAPKELIDYVVEGIRAKGLRVTPQRRAVLMVLLESGNNHLSAEEIHARLKQQYEATGLATVYRTLSVLEGMGVVRSTDFGDGRARYEIADVSSHYHHHLICTSCGRVEEVEDDLLQQIEEHVMGRHGFKVLNHSLKLFGLCRHCRDQRKGNP
ncbi:MAG: Fur family transcriptional regulator [Bacillota bacterium]